MDQRQLREKRNNRICPQYIMKSDTLLAQQQPSIFGVLFFAWIYFGNDIISKWPEKQPETFHLKTFLLFARSLTLSLSRPRSFSASPFSITFTSIFLSFTLPTNIRCRNSVFSFFCVPCLFQTLFVHLRWKQMSPTFFLPIFY